MIDVVDTMLRRTATVSLAAALRAKVGSSKSITGERARVSWEEDAVISLEDCIALSGLTEEEVRALAEHEQIDQIHAAALAQCLLGQADGCRKIGAMIADDVNSAILRGDRRHASELLATLERFVTSHPEALASKRAQACLGGRAACDT